MALINRIARVFKADVHAVLDQVEQPDLLLRQSIREMEDAIASAQETQRGRENETASLKLRIGQLDVALQETEEHLDVCFESGEDGLARDMTRAKLETIRLHRHLTARLRSAEEALVRSRGLQSENQAVLESLRQKAEVLALDSGVQDGVTEEAFAGARAFRANASEVEAAFLKEKQKRAGS